MHPRLRFWLIVSLGTALGMVTAVEVAEESYLLGQVVAVAVLWLIAESLATPRPEAWVLAAALAGYVLANRGFAQLSLSRQLPLLPAEIALVVCIVSTTVRMALHTTSAIRRDSLNLAIILWMLLGAARLWPDFQAHGALALRDFATIYYALFFFVAQALGSHPASANLLRKTLLVACAVLPFSYQLVTRFPDFFLQYAAYGGTPLIFYKDDLVTAYFLAGFFMLLTVASWPRGWRIALALATYASAFTINSSRAAIVGLLLASFWWVVARRWATLKLQAVAVPVGVSLLTVVALVKDEPFRQSRVYTLYEHMVSIVDFSGTRYYSTEDRRYVGDNNRFRLSWWRSVMDETREGGPLFGLGFGADLAGRFVRTYEIDLGDEFNVRSPHSIVVTVLGRMGLVGLTLWLGVMAAIATRTWRTARAARNDDAHLPALGWWSASWVILGSACFGVVLEGPMGAVVFWSLLGLANAHRDPLLAAEAIAESTESEISAPPLQPAWRPVSGRNLSTE